MDSNTVQMDNVKKIAWCKSNVVINECLNVKEVFVHLNCRGCLTHHEVEELQIESKTDSHKKKNLLMWMPTKGRKWLAHFVGALKETTNGTGHAQIIEALQKNLYEAAREEGISQRIVDAEAAG